MKQLHDPRRKTPDELRKMMRGPVTLSRVAAKLGISKSLLSLRMSGARPFHWMEIDRTEQAIEELRNEALSQDNIDMRVADLSMRVRELEQELKEIKKLWMQSTH